MQPQPTHTLKLAPGQCSICGAEVEDHPILRDVCTPCYRKLINNPPRIIDGVSSPEWFAAQPEINYE